MTERVARNVVTPRGDDASGDQGRGTKEQLMVSLGNMRARTAVWWIPELVCFSLVTIGFGSLPAHTQVADSSPYKGRPVVHPEEWSGMWEASNGQGGVVGIHLLLGTTVAPDAKMNGRSLTDVQQQWESFDVGVYEQRGSSFQFGDEGYFHDLSIDFPVKLEDGRLQLHYYSRVLGGYAVDLDLVKQPGDRWVGRFHRGGFDRQVTLERPRVDRRDPVAGTWVTEEGQTTRIHLGRQRSGGLIAWSDSIQVPGRIGFNPPAKLHPLYQQFGERVNVGAGQGTQVSFEFGAYAGFCCPRRFVGILDKSGSSIEGGWEAGMNQTPHSAAWRRVTGN